MKHGDQIAPPSERCLQRIHQPFADPLPVSFRLQDEAIHDRLDRVLLCLEKLDRLRTPEINDLAVDPQADESLAARAIDHIAEFTRFISDERSQQHQARPLGPRQDLLRDLPG